MVGEKGIEPFRPTCKDGTLPLRHSPIKNFGGPIGVRIQISFIPRMRVCRLHFWAILVAKVGFEPTEDK